MKFIIIYNPTAGKNNLQLISRMEHSLMDAGHSVIIEETKYKKHSTEIALKYKSEDCTIIACGGDGTFHEIANGLANGKAGFIALPFGTGNDFCKKLYGKGVPAKEVAEKFGLLDGSPCFKSVPSDLIAVNDFWCINVMSIGFDTLVETEGRKIISKLPFLGQLGYKLAVFACLFKDKNFSLKLTSDSKAKKPNDSDKIDCSNFTLFAICNASYYGGGFYPAPDSKLDDGVLDICIADSVKAHEILMLAPSYMAGKADKKSDKIHTYTVTSGHISSVDDKPLKFNCDGENYFISDIEFKVVKGAINICYPVKTAPIPELV